MFDVDSRGKTNQKKLTKKEIFEIMNVIRDKYNLSDIYTDILYLRVVKNMEVKEITKQIYQEYYPNKQLPSNHTQETYTMKKLATKDMKEASKELLTMIKDAVNEKNKIKVMTIDERMLLLSEIARGNVCEPAKSPYGGVFQKPADIKTRIQAMNILNDFDLKAKELNTSSEFIINITGDSITNMIEDMDAFKNNLKDLSKYRNVKHESDKKVDPETINNDSIKDVM